ncbi:serine O-acetyltransferase [Ferruginivarius sediminum]|uniref:serine O-acetyltransferase n=1 Tax=Ferruginivarius sediminum TaxID=2661937 RepID=A0A369T7Q5_9PROT|nr:serine O-acetyltransferase [Ferruginivarius sediminum]RDD61353.1 serine O-acetyltransferase [Ferruginivarius sediminum]
MFKSLRDEIDGIMARDPAARSWLEVVLCYPGFQALAFYRMANWLWRHGFHLSGRWVSHLGRVLTGIEIHPGARIGRNLFIDHGMGVVIGETAEIGDDVTLYHGVTLGGISPSENSDEQRNRKRHPTLGDRVIVGSGAQVLGPFEVGECARIGANAVVTKPVPARATMVGNPAKQLPMRDQPHEAEPRFVAYGTPTGDIPDPVARALDGLLQEVHGLRARVQELESQQGEGRGTLPPHGEEQETEREETRQSRVEGKC